MRTGRGWFDSVSLDLWYPWILAAIVALLLAAKACEPQAALAGQVSLDLKGGVAVPIRTTPDGTYWQEALPHDTKLLTGAYGLGVNYQHTPTLSFQAHYLNLGSSRINGRAVSDENYDHKAHKCRVDCSSVYQYNFQATDSLKGGDLTATYTWQGEGVRPFVKGGLALLYHQARFRNTDTGDIDRLNGWLPELELGAGLAYEWAYMELDYFQGMNFGGQNLPISTQQVALFAGVKVGL